ncbi:MAG: ABC transporter ATP-binding protein [Actinomycetota bacterium]|nr:ABC transporter ATP-binding protein [Actinomycetota bacterium]
MANELAPPGEDLELLEHRYRGEHLLRTYAYLFRRERGRVLASLGLFLVKVSPAVVLPFVTARIVDVVAEGRSLSTLWLYAIGMAVLLAQNIPTHYLHVKLLSHATRTIETRLRSAICRRLQHLSLGFTTERGSAALETKVLRDVENVEQMSRILFDQGLNALVTILFALAVTLVRAPAFAVFYVAVVPVAAFVIILLRRSMNHRNSVFRRELEHMSSRVAEMTHLLPVTRAHGLERPQLDRMSESFVRVRRAGMELDAVNAMFSGVSWVTFQLFNLVCLVLAAWAYRTGAVDITIGDVVMLTGFFNQLTSAVLAMAGLAPQLTKGVESIRSMGEVLQSPDVEENEGKAPVRAVRGAISFEGVGFRYPGADEWAVHDITLDVEPGTTLAFVGPSGSGKSTLVNLVIGFIRPTAGRIVLDGRDMASLDLRTFRSHLSVVPQESLLFEGSVRENVAHGLEGVDDDRIVAALADANALEFVERMADGLDTPIGQEGTRLSGGQKQRLAIARALLRDPKVLILDEATSALDTASEALVQEALGRLMAGRTTFVVAHRLSTIRDADQIAVLDAGGLVEVGRYDDLVHAGGTFAALAGRQAS